MATRHDDARADSGVAEREIRMRNDHEPALLDRPAWRPQPSLTVCRRPCSDRRCVLYVEGPLLTPVDGQLRHTVRTLLRLGQRIIVLDLNRVPRIDAGGVGELVRAYNMATEAGGLLQVVRTTAWVRHILRRVGLLDILRQG